MTSASGDIDCANSGTTMRLLAGVVAGSPFRTALTGDDSLLRRPMERVAEPLRAMGARVQTVDGRAPISIEGGELHGVRWDVDTPSAQVKGAILLAGLAAEGTTEVFEPARTRDHTERALRNLGAAVETSGQTVRLKPFQHKGFEGTVPGDVSSGAFLIAAAALTGGTVNVDEVGLNPTRTHFLDVMRRMGVAIDVEEHRLELGEPVGSLRADEGTDLRGTVVPAQEFPLTHDEVLVLALLAAHANGESRFEGASELRLKEADRLSGLAEGIRELGGEAAVEGDTLVVAGGGLSGGRADARGDHRLAMAFVVGSLGARGDCEVTGLEWADVSYPGFARVVGELGGAVELQPE